MMICGRALALWKEEMVRATAWLDSLRMASAWIRSWELETKLILLQEPLMGYCLEDLLGADDQVERGPDRASIRRHSLVLPNSAPISGIIEAGKWHRDSSRHGFKDEAAIGAVPNAGYPTEEHSGPVEYLERSDLLAARSQRRSITHMPLPESGIDDGSAIALDRHPSGHGFNADPRISEESVTNHRLAEHHGPHDLPAAWNRRHLSLNEQASKSEAKDGEPSNSPGNSEATTRKSRVVLEGAGRQASSDLLSRLAGDVPDTQEQQRRRIMWPSASQRKAPVMNVQDMADLMADLTDHRSWLINMAETVARSLYQIDPSCTLDSGMDSRTSLDKMTALESQLTMSITGPRATSQLLSAMSLQGSARFKRLASGSDIAGRPDRRFKGDIQSVPDSNNARAISHTGPSCQPQSNPAKEQISVWDSVSGRDMMERVLPGMRMRSAGGITDIVCPDEKDQIAPLEADSALPPLHSLPGDRITSLPAEAPIARSDVQRGLLEDDVDLADLAAKIKRILDDEARRHGIDV
jgi:hypothetical protein